METEERPSKIRKLSHGSAGNSSQPDQDALIASNDLHTDHVNGGLQAPASADGVGSANADISDTEKRADIEDSSSLPNVSVPSTHPLHALAISNPTLSKSQLKKLRRQQEWEEARAFRKEKRRDQAANKKARKRAERDAYLSQAGLTLAEHSKRLAEESQQNRSVTVPITFMIDCGFDEFMNDSERISLSGQITRAYSDNRKAPWRGHLVVAHFDGKLKERHDTVLKKSYESWKGFRWYVEPMADVAARGHEWMTGKEGGKLAGPFAHHSKAETIVPSGVAHEDDDHASETQAYIALNANPAEREATSGENVSTSQPKTTTSADPRPGLRAESEIVYLSSESPYTLTELKPYSTYIVGGLVDKNREKGICYKRACAAGIKTARLPIGEFLDMQSRKVLATNHVVEIMLRWLEYGDWGRAFVEVMPKRKGGQLKSGISRQSTEAAEDEGTEGDAEEDPNAQ